MQLRRARTRSITPRPSPSRTDTIKQRYGAPGTSARDSFKSKKANQMNFSCTGMEQITPRSQTTDTNTPVPRKSSGSCTAAAPTRLARHNHQRTCVRGAASAPGTVTARGALHAGHVGRPWRAVHARGQQAAGRGAGSPARAVEIFRADGAVREEPACGAEGAGGDGAAEYRARAVAEAVAAKGARERRRAAGGAVPPGRCDAGAGLRERGAAGADATLRTHGARGIRAAAATRTPGGARARAGHRRADGAVVAAGAGRRRRRAAATPGPRGARDAARTRAAGAAVVSCRARARAGARERRLAARRAKVPARGGV